MKKSKITIIILIVLVVVVTPATIYIYLNRSLIFEYSINKLINELLPDYIKVENLDIDFETNYITLKNLKVSNPKGFRRTPFIIIPRVNASYIQQDEKDILKGVVISGVVLFEPVIYVERLKDGNFNIHKIAEAFRSSEGKKRPSFKARLLAVLSYMLCPVKKTYDVDEIKRGLEKIVKSTDEAVKIKPVLNVKGGSLIFNDCHTYLKGYKTSVEEIHAKITLRFKEGLKGIDYVESEGTGFINGQTDQTLHWIIAYEPDAPKLTMSNTFKIRNADLIHLRPYYDKFSPFVFGSGKADGELTINFDNGVIGSMNEIRLFTPKLEIKGEYPLKEFWAVNGQELRKYFASQSGEILFDFEIKGPMEQPKFYLGPKTRMALTKMVIDKISDVLFGKTGESQPQQETQGTPQNEETAIQKIINGYKKLKESR